MTCNKIILLAGMWRQEAQRHEEGAKYCALYNRENPDRAEVYRLDLPTTQEQQLHLETARVLRNCARELEDYAARLEELDQ